MSWSRPTPAGLAALLVLAAGLTGCLGTADEASSAVDGTDEAIAEDPGPTVDFRACDQHVVAASVPREPVASGLPEGYTPGFGDLDARPAGSSTEVDVIAYACDEVRVNGTDVGPTTLVRARVDAWVPLDDPAAPGGGGTVPLFVVAEEGELAATLSSWGLPVSTGDVRLERPDGPGSNVARLVADTPDLHLEMETAVQPGEDTEAGGEGVTTRTPLVDPPPILEGGDPEVVGHLNRTTWAPFDFALGSGSYELSGEDVPASLGRPIETVGFASTDGDLNVTWRPIREVPGRATTERGPTPSTVVRPVDVDGALPARAGGCGPAGCERIELTEAESYRQLDLDGAPRSVSLEVSWDPASPATEELNLFVTEVRPCQGDCNASLNWTVVSGTSPLTVEADELDWPSNATLGFAVTKETARAFTAGLEASPEQPFHVGGEVTLERSGG